MRKKLIITLVVSYIVIGLIFWIALNIIESNQSTGILCEKNIKTGQEVCISNDQMQVNRWVQTTYVIFFWPAAFFPMNEV